MKPSGSAGRPAALGLLAGGALLTGLAGCGTSDLSTSQLRSGARLVCTAAARRTNRIPLPSAPSGEARFLTQGITVLTSEVRELDSLRSGNPTFRGAVIEVGDEVAALRFSLKGVRSGNDPVVAIKTLQQKLAPLEHRADQAWNRLGITSCADR